MLVLGILVVRIGLGGFSGGYLSLTWNVERAWYN